MKKFIITYIDPQSGSCDMETIFIAGGMRAAKAYAENNKDSWAVKSVVAR